MPRTIAGWQADYARERQEFRELTGSEVPASGAGDPGMARGQAPAEALAAWERTPSGLLSTEEAELTRMALEWPEVRPLIAVRTAEKRIETFGQQLLDQIVPATGRLHGGYFLPTVTGRLSLPAAEPAAAAGRCPGCRRGPEGHRLLEGD